MSQRVTLPSLFAGLIAIAALAGCGSSSTTSSSSGSSSSSAAAAAGSSSAASSSSAAAAAGATSCPSTSTVGGALGQTVASPTTLSDSGLPAGATGISCEYLAGTSVVIVVVANGVPSSFFSTEETSEQTSASSAGLNINFAPISGVGSEAASYTYSIDGVSASGVIAQSGSTVAGVFTSMLTGVTISQEENLVKDLL